MIACNLIIALPFLPRGGRGGVVLWVCVVIEIFRLTSAVHFNSNINFMRISDVPYNTFVILVNVDVETDYTEPQNNVGILIDTRVKVKFILYLYI